MGASKINTTEVQKIQIDHGIVYVDYGETSQRLLAPTRGGGEFKATVTVRDIEFDGRNGKTAGMQVIEENAASLAVTLLGMTQENLRLAMQFHKKIEGLYPSLARPMVVASKLYNQHLTTGSMLIEIGTDANSIDEAKYSAELVGNSLVALLGDLK